MRLTVATTRSGARALRDEGWGDFAELVALPCEDGQRVRRQVAEQVLLPLAARALAGADSCTASRASLAPYPGARATSSRCTTSRSSSRARSARVTTLGHAQARARAPRATPTS